MQVEALKLLADYFLGLFAGAMCLAGVLYLVKSRHKKNSDGDGAYGAESVSSLDFDIHRHGESEDVKRGRVAYTARA